MFKRNLIAGVGLACVALWIVGLVLGQGATSNLADNASDAQVLAWVKGNDMKIIVGAWLFISGCVLFVWFAALLRERLGESTAATLVYSASLLMAVLGSLSQSDLAPAINKNDVSPATAGALHHFGDLAFCGLEIALVLFLGAIAVLAFRTRVVPRWWGVVSAVLAVGAWIGPIGWAVVIFGLPVWTLVTPWLLGRGAGRHAVAAAPAV